jgi:hypothetical protein
MSFEDGIKMWREEIGQYYDEHFSEEEMEILYEIVRGNVDVDKYYFRWYIRRIYDLCICISNN